MYDENYQKRITNSTPANIRIRRFYNQLNGRPLNYGMEDLFPNMKPYTNQPSMMMEQLNNAPSQISGFTMPQKKDFHLADIA